MDLAAERLRRCRKNDRRRRRRRQLRPRAQFAPRRQRRRAQLSRNVQRAGFTTDLDPAHGRDDPTRRLRAAGLRRAAAGPAGRHGGTGGNLYAPIQCGDDARGRYVQGVGGFVLVGGFGSFSKNYGTAAANLLEAEIVTADGAMRIANACINPDLFWALKGGGGGTFGVVTRLTLRTHELPKNFGGAGGKIKARSDAAFAHLIGRFIDFYSKKLFNPHWGETVHFQPDNSLEFDMACEGLDSAQVVEIWRPFFDWVEARPQDFTVT